MTKSKRISGRCQVAALAAAALLTSAIMPHTLRAQTTESTTPTDHELVQKLLERVEKQDDEIKALKAHENVTPKPAQADLSAAGGVTSASPAADSAATPTTAPTNPEVLKPLVANLKKFVEDHQYDGLDLDWEYPTTDADTAELLTFMTALRKALPSPRYLLSIDAAPWTEPSYDVPHLKKVIDWFNIMTYDCAGPWTAHAQLNSPIFWDSRNCPCSTN